MEEFHFDPFESYAKIVVIGVGGGGSNAVNKMLEDRTGNIVYWVFNTDAQALATSKAENRLVLGKNLTKGLGAGGDPAVGREAALDSLEEIKQVIEGADMVFIAAGMGGGTGTGAAPIVAKCAKEAGALTVAIVTRPFNFEGQTRKVKAVEGINELRANVDSIIIVSNDSLMMFNGSRSLGEAFSESDRVLSQSVKTITDLIILPGVINLDFADVKSTLSGKGIAMIGFGMGSGEKKALDAATSAITCPLLEASIRGCRSAIINVTGGQGVTLADASDAVDYITEAAGNNINIIFGVQQNPALNDTMMISIIATDFDDSFEADEQHPLVASRTKSELKAETVKAPVFPVPTPAEIRGQEESILPNFLQRLKKSGGSEEPDED